MSDSSINFPFNSLHNGEDLHSEARSILEVNPKHPLIHKIKDEKDASRFEQLTNIIYDQAVLSEGKGLSNSSEYVKSINSLLLELLN